MAQKTVTCEKCGQRFEWKKSLAGKTVKCKCGGIFVVPAQIADGAPVAALQSAVPLPPTAPRFNPPKKELPHRYASAYDEEGQRREQLTNTLMCIGAIILLAGLLFAGREFLAGRSSPDQNGDRSLPAIDRTLTPSEPAQQLPAVAELDGPPVYDKEIEQLIAWGKSHELLSWMKTPGHGVVEYFWTRDLTEREGEAWYRNGAKNVLVFGEVWTTFIAIELPPERDRRKYFFDYAERFRSTPAGHGPASIVAPGARNTQVRLPNPPQKDIHQKYLVLCFMAPVDGQKLPNLYDDETFKRSDQP